MSWIYVSPHLDDVAFSCGGLIWEQTKSGEQVSIWTIFAGDPPVGTLSDFAEKLQIRWKGGRESMSIRRQEDIIACNRLGATYRHFTLPDCVYRGPRSPSNYSNREPQDGVTSDVNFFYTSHDSLFGPIHPQEAGLADQLRKNLAKLLPEGTKLVCPLALGNHVDHQLTRSALEKLGWKMWYYADYPYITDHLEGIEALERSKWQSQLFTISDEGMFAWKEAVAAHGSQISSFWSGLEAMQENLEDYREFVGGVALWAPPEPAGSFTV